MCVCVWEEGAATVLQRCSSLVPDACTPSLAADLRWCVACHAHTHTQVLPVAFLASHDEVASVSSAWGAVWSEGCPSEPAALRLHARELAGLIAGGLGSSMWGRKRSAAKVGVVWQW